MKQKLNRFSLSACHLLRNIFSKSLIIFLKSIIIVTGSRNQFRNYNSEVSKKSLINSNKFYLLIFLHWIFIGQIRCERINLRKKSGVIFPELVVWLQVQVLLNTSFFGTNYPKFRGWVSVYFFNSVLPIFWFK